MELKILQLLLFLCMKALVSGVGAAAEVRCIERERQALLKISGNLSGLPWGSEECCDWDGVHCTDTGHVFSLYLYHMELGGNVSTIDNLNWLSDVPLLSFLDLSGINLSTVTNWVQPITKHSSLETLYLSHCQLRDPLPAFDVFANSSSSCLSELDLSDNDLTSFSALESLFNFSTILSQLDLSNNAFHGGVHRPLENLSHLHLLEDIDLSNNQLVGSLPDITRFSSLKYLDLRNNHLDGLHPQSLYQPSSLQSLDLSGNQLKRLPKAIGQLLYLEYLNLSLTSLEGTITEDHLANFPQLKVLDLSSNNVSFNLSFDWIPPFQLITIHLSHCNVGPYFPNWIRTQNSLRRLYLSFAGISDTLPNWLRNMTSIWYLDLSHNDIRGRMPDLAHLYNRLDLSHNNLSGPIPLSVFQYSVMLTLSKNLLSGSIFNLCTISEGIMIIYLDLSDNQLDGEIPDCWMNLNGLTVLNLANNKFTGKLPPTLSNLGRLATLHLGNNNFTGELPSSWKNCTMLNKLDVGGNKLTGPIPAWIGTHLTFLVVLSLRFNSFHGTIPPTICYLTYIHVLDLSRNNISGIIPRCLNNLTSLVQNDGSTIPEDSPSDYLFDYGRPVEGDDNDKYNALVQWKGQESEYIRQINLKGIDLSSNKLVGTIPQAFSDLRGLVFINLSRNHLTGNIISSIDQLDTLEWLDLSRNQLSGEIPNGFAKLHFLCVLDLSYNNLTGKIPLSTQLQSFNPSVYAGNNQLCGDPLAECPQDPSTTNHGKVNIVEEDERFINRDFYICMAFGFITGFWMVVGTLVLKHSWRHSYFNFWNNIGDWMYVTTTIYVTRFKTKFMS